MKTIIVGGGLSGLAVADGLERAGQEYLLLEGRSRLGGRILSDDYDGAAFDLGPSWFWPGQSRIAALVERLGAETFEQYAIGDTIAEDAQGQVHRGQGFASMEGSLRLKGGLKRLTEGLAGLLPSAQLRLDARVQAVTLQKAGVSVLLDGGEKVTADRVVLAMPPRLAAQLTFAPGLPEQTLRVMGDVPTWMAGHAKAVAIYDRPIWREAGLSGDAVSRVGPMVEIHDASPAGDQLFAVFGFIGVPPNARNDEAVMRQQICAQLGRLFGTAAAEPLKLLLKDWAFDPLTASQADLAPLYAHPSYGLPPELVGNWDGRLLFAGTEVAPQFGGYIEGALEAAERVLGDLSG